jgi:hypothetical protein
VGHPQEIKRLRLPLASSPSVCIRESPELDQPRLRFVQFQAKFRQACFHLLAKSLRLGAVLKAHDQIVRVAYDDHVAPGLFTPLLYPLIQAVVQVHVRQ